MLANKTTDWVSFVHTLESRVLLKVNLKTMEELDQETEKRNADIQQEIWKNTETARNNFVNEIRNMVAENRYL